MSTPDREPPFDWPALRAPPPERAGRLGGETAAISALQGGRGESADPPCRRVEVTVARDACGRRQVLLQDLSYGPGVGWYIQKTIRLDPEQVEALMRSLCCARTSASSQGARLTRGNPCPAAPPGGQAPILRLENRSPRPADRP